MPSAVTTPPPVLSDGVVTLRAPRADDGDDITLGCQDPQNQLWTTIPVPYARGDADEWLAKRPTPEAWWAYPTWAVTVPPSDRWGGNIDLRPDGEGGAEVGYLLAPWARGHGHAARALRLVCAWAFSTLGVQAVTWYAFVGNEASRHTARRVGFQISDHVFRGYGAQRGERRDSWIGTLMPDDLAAAVRLGDGRSRYLGPELTRRELDVLRQLTLGRSNRDIAADLGISENTVKNHVRSILEKLQAKSRSEAVVIGLRQGLTSMGS
jgi:RimJ/RimL family protein N-acetyltransferase/DNA-binding CsgD family transcriptional regulator